MVPCYPRGLFFGTVVGSRSPEGRCTWQRYWANAVDVPGPATEALGKVARETGTYLAVGVIERDTQFSGGTLYCTPPTSAQMATFWANTANSSSPPPNV